MGINTRGPVCSRKILRLGEGAALGLVIASSAIVIPVHADTTDDGSTLQEVVVTAQRREENLQQTPIAVTAFDAAGLVNNNVNSIADLGNLVPNLAISSSSYQTPSAALPVIYIRGIGQQGPAIYTDPGVAIYVDGVYVANSVGGAIDLPDIARVEVLRGPQGTLFGKNAIGGAVNVVTQVPGQSPQTEFEASTGNYGLVHLRGYTNVAISDTFGVTAAFDDKREDGFGWRLAYPSGDRLGRLGDEDHFSARIKARWTPVDRLSIELSAEETRYADTATPSQTIVVPAANLTKWNTYVGAPLGKVYSQADAASGRYDNYSENPQCVNDDIKGFQTTVGYDLGWAKLKSITAYRDAADNFSRDADGSPILYFEDTRQMHSRQTTEELQLIGDLFDSHLSYIMGAFYLHDHSEQGDIFYVTPGLFAADPHPNGSENVSRLTQAEQTTYSRAAFVQATWRFTDKLSLTAGVRYTAEQKEINLFEQSQETGVVGLPNVHSAGRWPATTPHASLDYQISKDLLAYASATRGFKSGGFNGNASNLAGFVNFQPETVWSYEVGLKSEFLDHRVRANLAAFRTNYDNIQLNLITNGVNTVFNVDAARLYGYEAELTIIPVGRLELFGSVGYVHDKYTEIQPAVTGITYSNEIPYTPNYTESAGARYGIELAGYGTMTPSLNFSYRSSAFTQPNNSAASYMPGYGLLSARIQYAPAHSNWTVSLFGTNLTDKRYIVSAGDSTGSGVIVHVFGAPMEYGVTFADHF
jgi:iron complex outermembrane recepter protein